MKVGTIVEIDKDNASKWGYKVPALGTVIGPDPRGNNKEVVAVRLNKQWGSIYETNGVHTSRLTVPTASE